MDILSHHNTSYDPYAHALSLSIHMPELDPTQYFSKTPLNEVSGLQFFEQLVGSVQVDSSYSGAKYGAIDRGNPSFDAGLGKDSDTSQSEEAIRVGSLRIHSGEDDEDEREDAGGHDDDDNDDDDDNGNGDGDDHETVPMVEASSSGHRPTPGKSRPPTNPTQRKKAKNDGWEQTCPANGGPQDPVLVPSYSGHVAGSIWRGQDRGILKSRSRYVSLTDSSIGINGQDLVSVAKSPRSRLSTEQMDACYVLYLLGSSLFTDKSLDIAVFSYVCTSGETESEVVQTAYPEVCGVRSQNGEQINRHTHSFRHDDC
ncbi:hypothetical protein M9H77_11658 [Catharanthus roseus]|uniref:Uncharacterized protein n=1 Tax=Catharanthus roseus TaxID=4058 RepID=A0ACC0BF76_CATRO|nr:hypothetical protein M9H77_11658 [Catharanthus roseus]